MPEKKRILESGNQTDGNENIQRRDFLKALGVVGTVGLITSLFPSALDEPPLISKRKNIEKPDPEDIDFPQIFAQTSIPQNDACKEKFEKEVKNILNKLHLGYLPFFLHNYQTYIPPIQQTIQEKNIPTELVTVPIVESSLRVDAKSRAGAVGLWQLMPKTAQELGLRVDPKRKIGIRYPYTTTDPETDERYNVEKSTDAATNYLKKLYKSFDDWLLTLAAYNWGRGNMRKATDNYDIKDFFAIESRLPKETQQYIYRAMAYHKIMNHPYFQQKLKRFAIVAKYTSSSS